jgi:dynein assembly factor with WDR repeat domains 1
MGHEDEVLDINFNATGTQLVTASMDSTARIYNVNTSACTGVLEGH